MEFLTGQSDKIVNINSIFLRACYAIQQNLAELFCSQCYMETKKELIFQNMLECKSVIMCPVCAIGEVRKLFKSDHNEGNKTQVSA
jgi:hypothetical protein